MRFKDQVVVITGGAGGLGLVFGKAFGAEGAQVVITDLDAATVARGVEEIEKIGGRAMGLVGDVSDPQQVDDHVKEILGAFGQIDVLVNNAGIMFRTPTEDLPLDKWRRIMAVNLDGTFYWSQAVAIQSMIPRQKGSIINIASIGGIVAFPNAAAYTASKAAVIGLTKILAIDWSQHNIRVNALCPAMTWGSDLSKADMVKNPNHFIDRVARVPLGRGAAPEEQASALLFLASEEASFVQGLIMNVDGGQLALSSGHSTPRKAEVGAL